MSKQTNSEVERTLSSIKVKLLSIFAIIGVIGAVLFLLAQGDIIPVVIPIIFVVISIFVICLFSC